MKYTIKEVRAFLRGLEENKYRKRYNIDAKRIHHFANNGVDSTLPLSISKKNENTTYARDKDLAKTFIKHIKEQEKIKKQHLRQEGQVRAILLPMIREEINKLTEAKVSVGFSNEMGALYVSKGNQKTVELKKADVEEIIKQYKKFKSKMD